MDKEIIKIISKELNIDLNRIKIKSKLKEDLNIDSIDMVQLINALEQKFKIEISIDSLPKITTVEDITNYIKSNI